MCKPLVISLRSFFIKRWKFFGVTHHRRLIIFKNFKALLIIHSCEDLKMFQKALRIHSPFSHQTFFRMGYVRTQLSYADLTNLFVGNHILSKKLFYGKILKICIFNFFWFSKIVHDNDCIPIYFYLAFSNNS